MSSRRASEGSRGSAAGMAGKLRASLRKAGRVRTVSAGSLPPSREGTPAGSLEGDGREQGRLRKKLSFGGEEEVEVEEQETSPGQEPLPGEMFPLQDIVEEPERGEGRRGEARGQVVSASSSGVSSQGSLLQRGQQERVERREEGEYKQLNQENSLRGSPAIDIIGDREHIQLEQV